MSDSIEVLLANAFTDPSGTLAAANERLADSSDVDRCELLRVMGNACRELRRTDESVAHLDASLDLAVSIGDRRLEGNAAMSLAASLSYQGDFARSLDTVARAIDLLDGDDQIIAMSQRAGLLQRAGRQPEALDAFSVALELAAEADDQSVRGDLWMNRGVLYGFAGKIDAAEADTQHALDLFVEMGWDKRAADMQHNLAWLAGRRGDVVLALKRFDEAELAYERVGLTGTSVFPDRCEVLIAAGLAREALALAELSARRFADQGDRVDAAESLLLVARAALLSGDLDRALEASVNASEHFVQQGREGWQADAIALGLDARLRLGRVSAADRHHAITISGEAADAGLRSVSAAGRLVAAEIALALDDLAACATDAAAIRPADLGTVDRFRFDLVRARLATGLGRPRDALELCASGLHDFAEMSAALGGTELRAHIARHVEELVDFGVALALDMSDPMLALEWAERQRASVLSAPPVLPPASLELEHELNLLRSAMSELEKSAERGTGISDAQQRCALAQDRVRRLTRHARGSEVPEPGAGPATPGLLDDAAVVFVESDQRLHSIRLEGGRAVVTELGAFSVVQRQVALLQSTFAMYLSAVGRGMDRDPAAVLADANALDELLFPSGGLPGDRAVICPTGRIYDLPWGLLPTLSSAEFVLAPSLDSYLRCAAMNVERPTAAVAIAGPDLRFADDEAEVVCAAYPSSECLVGEAATVGNAKHLVQGADVAHIACHGRFVSGNPMFSSLGLWDGQMFVHEIERVRPPPAIAVLSACNAGLHSSPTGRQTLGLTTSLLAGGSRSIVAATVPLPDTVSTVDLMGALHARLVDGAGVAGALRGIRGDRPILGGAFSCHGAGWEPSR